MNQIRNLLVLGRRNHTEAMRVAAGLTIFGHKVRLVREWLDGVDIYGRGVDVTEVRTRIGMLAPKPFPNKPPE